MSHDQPPARSTFFAMIEHNEQYVRSRTRYSTNAFFRRRLGRQFTEAKLNHRLYRSFIDAWADLDTDGRANAGAEAASTRAPEML